MINKSKIESINLVIEKWFNSHSENRVAAKDLMPQFIAAGIFNADRKNGLPIRNVLRELDRSNKLSLIPYVLAERKKINTNWFFARQKENIFSESQIENKLSPCKIHPRQNRMKPMLLTFVMKCWAKSITPTSL
jgi:hypothetical protein